MVDNYTPPLDMRLKGYNLTNKSSDEKQEILNNLLGKKVIIDDRHEQWITGKIKEVDAVRKYYTLKKSGKIANRMIHDIEQIIEL